MPPPPTAALRSGRDHAPHRQGYRQRYRRRSLSAPPSPPPPAFGVGAALSAAASPSAAAALDVVVVAPRDLLLSVRDRHRRRRRCRGDPGGVDGGGNGGGDGTEADVVDGDGGLVAIDVDDESGRGRGYGTDGAGAAMAGDGGNARNDGGRPGEEEGGGDGTSGCEGDDDGDGNRCRGEGDETKVGRDGGVNDDKRDSGEKGNDDPSSRRRRRPHCRECSADASDDGSTADDSSGGSRRGRGRGVPACSDFFVTFPLEALVASAAMSGGGAAGGKGGKKRGAGGKRAAAAALFLKFGTSLLRPPSPPLPPVAPNSFGDGDGRGGPSPPSAPSATPVSPSEERRRLLQDGGDETDRGGVTTDATTTMRDPLDPPPPPPRERGNVRIRINGIDVPQLDMRFQRSGRGATAASDPSLGGGGGGGKGGEPACRFLEGNGIRPSSKTLEMLVRGRFEDDDDDDDDCYYGVDDTTTDAGADADPAERGRGGRIRRRGNEDSTPILRLGWNHLRYTLHSAPSPSNSPSYPSSPSSVICVADANLYLWSSSDSVVVSDVDGTVTRSDVGGVMDTVLRDRFEHVHWGICKFFHDISRHGVEEGAMEGSGKVGGGHKGEESGSFEVELMGPAGYAVSKAGKIDGGGGGGDEGDDEGGGGDDKGGGGGVGDEGDDLENSDDFEKGKVRFLFLSSRPISLVGQTRKFLVSLSQSHCNDDGGDCGTKNADAVIVGRSIGGSTTSNDGPGGEMGRTSPSRVSPLFPPLPRRGHMSYGLPQGPLFCHRGPLSAVLYSELVAKDIHNFKADVLLRQVVVPFAAARGGGGEGGGTECSRFGTPAAKGNATGPVVLPAQIRTEPPSAMKIRRSDTCESAGDDRASNDNRRIFLAGFGNKSTDAAAYEMAGMDRRDIYLIGKDSRVACVGLRVGEVGGGRSNSNRPLPRPGVSEGASDVIDACCFPGEGIKVAAPPSPCKQPILSLKKGSRSDATAATKISDDAEGGVSVEENDEEEVNEAVEVRMGWGGGDVVGDDPSSSSAANVLVELVATTTRKSRIKSISQTLRSPSVSLKRSLTRKLSRLDSSDIDDSRSNRSTESGSTDFFDGYGDPFLLGVVASRIRRHASN